MANVRQYSFRNIAQAFDSVHHSKLIAKLMMYGIYGPLLQWIDDFLTRRSHRTRIGNSLSDVAYITSGIIQGSCLGPILFLMIYLISSVTQLH